MNPEAQIGVRGTIDSNVGQTATNCKPNLHLMGAFAIAPRRQCPTPTGPFACRPPPPAGGRNLICRAALDLRNVPIDAEIGRLIRPRHPLSRDPEIAAVAVMMGLHVQQASQPRATPITQNMQVWLKAEILASEDIRSLR